MALYDLAGRRLQDSYQFVTQVSKSSISPDMWSFADGLGNPVYWFDGTASYAISAGYADTAGFAETVRAAGIEWDIQLNSASATDGVLGVAELGRGYYNWNVGAWTFGNRLTGSGDLVGSWSFHTNKDNYAIGDYSIAHGYKNIAVDSSDSVEGYNSTTVNDTVTSFGLNFTYDITTGRLYSLQPGDFTNQLNTIELINSSYKKWFYNATDDIIYEVNIGSIATYDAINDITYIDTNNAGNTDITGLGILYYQSFSSDIKGEPLANHAEGDSTIASGDASHAQGKRTYSYGVGSHSEGLDTISSNSGSHAEGRNTQAKGDASHAEGSDSIASGSAAHAEGYNTLAQGEFSHAEGFYTIAFGDTSHAAGRETISSGYGSRAIGYQTIASGAYSNSEGVNTLAAATGSHSEGTASIASGNYSHAEGEKSLASGISSHAEGIDSSASADWSHAEGSNTVANSKGSHAEGYYTITIGNTGLRKDIIGNHAEGWYTRAIGLGAHSEGIYTTASGDYSHAEGGNTLASNEGSHAEGRYTTTIGVYSHAEGMMTTASGDYSHAEGSASIAIGSGSHAEGWGTVASGSFQSVVGRFNTLGNTDDYFVVGDGTSGARSNALGVNNTRFYASNSIFFPDLTQVTQTNVLSYDVNTKRVFYQPTSSGGTGGVGPGIVPYLAHFNTTNNVISNTIRYDASSNEYFVEGNRTTIKLSGSITIDKDYGSNIDVNNNAPASQQLEIENGSKGYIKSIDSTPYQYVYGVVIDYVLGYNGDPNLGFKNTDIGMIQLTLGRTNASSTIYTIASPVDGTWSTVFNPGIDMNASETYTEAPISTVGHNNTYQFGYQFDGNNIDIFFNNFNTQSTVFINFTTKILWMSKK